MLWSQNYTPAGGSLALSAAVAALPLAVLLVLLGLLRKPGWVAALAALATAVAVTTGVFGMPIGLAVSAGLYGAAYGIFPICWIMFWAILLCRIPVETGRFEAIKDSIGGVTRSEERRVGKECR